VTSTVYTKSMSIMPVEKPRTA